MSAQKCTSGVNRFGVKGGILEIPDNNAYCQALWMRVSERLFDQSPSKTDFQGGKESVSYRLDAGSLPYLGRARLEKVYS